MDEKSLLAVAILLSLIGIALIVYASPRIVPPHFSIQDITPSQVGEVISTSGTLIREAEASGVRILTLRDNATIQVPLFGMDIRTELGDTVGLDGTVKIYKGSLEVVPVMGRIRVSRPVAMPVMVSDIGPGMRYKVVSVSGEAGMVVPVTNGYLFDIGDGSGEVRVAAFGREIDVEAGGFYTVEGMVDTYKGELEIMYRSSRT